MHFLKDLYVLNLRVFVFLVTRKMSNSGCSVINCKNTSRNCDGTVHFYSFPRAAHKLEQRKRWIAAIKRTNPDGSVWEPKVFHRICSVHFIGNAKSDSMLSPSYAPTIFPSNYNKPTTNEETRGQQALKRHQRFMQRRLMIPKAKINQSSPAPKNPKTTLKTESFDIEFVKTEPAPTYSDKGTDVNFLSDVDENSMTFICNRFNNSFGLHDAECQTNINIKISQRRFIIPCSKKVVDKYFGNHHSMIDKCVGSTFDEITAHCLGFTGFDCIQSNEQMVDLTGVSLISFHSLLRLIPDIENSKVSKENRLLITLCKVNTGLSLAALGVFFSVHRSTISRICSATLPFLEGPKKTVTNP